MLRESASFLVLGALAFGCGSSENRPGTNAGLCVPIDGGAQCRGGGGGGGGTTPPTLDSGVASLDGGDGATLSTVSGTLRLFPMLPPGTTTQAGTSGWTVTAIPPTDYDAGDPMINASTTGTGDFVLPAIPPQGASPSTGVPSFWIAATFPVMGNIGTLFELSADTRVVDLQTFTDDTLRVSLNAVGLVQADDRAVIAGYIRQSRSVGAAPVTNVLLTADGQSSATLYDGPSGLMEISATGTGARGFVILPNVPVPLSGDGFITVSGPRLTRSYQVRVRRHMMSWVLLTAS